MPESSSATTSGLQALTERLNRWQADGTLDNLFGLAEGLVGLSDALTDRMVQSAGSGLVSALALLDTLHQNEKAREGLIWLLEKLGEWKETGTLDTLLGLVEGLVGVTQAVTDKMVEEAGFSLLGAMRFVQNLPEWEELEPLLVAYRQNAPLVQTLSRELGTLTDGERTRQELQGIPHVSGMISLGRALSEPDIQKGLRLSLLLLKRLGRALDT
jgi:uncharacterized protein YjgD (DUF1641 family)